MRGRNLWTKEAGKNRRKGFTLLELLAVIILIAILSYFGVKAFIGSSSTEAKVTKLKEHVTLVDAASQRFKFDTGYYPSRISYLWQKPNNLPGWKGPYLKPETVDRNNNILLKFLSDNSKMYVACSSDNYYQVVVDGVSNDVAQEYDKKYDDGNLSSGNVRYDSSSKRLTITLATKDYENIACY
jgi:general secretion pathway protein G